MYFTSSISITFPASIHKSWSFSLVSDDYTNLIILNVTYDNNNNAGYGKLPDYEHVFTDFLLNLKQKK